MEQTNFNLYKVTPMEIEGSESNDVMINNVLPDEILLQFFSLLDPQDLGKVAQVCERWQKLSLDNYIWKPLVNQLPKKYQELPCRLLKDKFVAFQNDAKEKINFVLQNADAQFKPNQFNDSQKIFTDKLIILLKYSNKTGKEKIEALDKEINGERSFFDKCQNCNKGGYIKYNLLTHLCSDRWVDNKKPVEILLKAGANPNLVKPNNLSFMNLSPLMEASSSSGPLDHRLVELLLKYGGDPFFANPNGNTAYQLAIEKDRQSHYPDPSDSFENLLSKYKG